MAQFTRHFSRNLKEGEEILREVRRYPWSFFWSGLATFILLLAPFFFLFPLLRLGTIGLVLLAILVIAGILMAVRIAVLYTFNVLLITNLRLIDIDQRGFFSQVVTETRYDAIQDVSVSIRGIAQTLLRYGNVHVQTAGAQANIEARSVRHPEHVHDLITSIQSSLRDGNNDLSADELVALVQKLKRGLGDERFSELIYGRKGKRG